MTLSPGISRELARQRELAIVRELERRRRPAPPLLAELLPSLSFVAGVLALLALTPA
jgi:hypothetical protein